jgi:hypothetical protein
MAKRANVTPRVRSIAVLSLAGSLALYAVLLFAFTSEQDYVNGPVPTRWQNNSVTWDLNPTTSSNISTNGGDSVTTVMQNSFNTWTSSMVNGQILNVLAVTQGPNSSLTDPNSADCVNVVSFTPSSAVSFPTGAIAFTEVATSFGPPPTTYPCTTPPTSRTCNLPSCLIDADIVFNPNELFSTTTPPLSGDFDLQSVATHEIGHFMGLDHSGLAHSVMFPYGDVGASEQRNVSADDAAALAFTYPSSNFPTATGTISGKATLSGSAAFAAHVLAIDASTGNVVEDTLSNADGSYSLVGLPQGTYNVLVLPLAPNDNTGIYALDNFSGWSCGYGGPDENSAPCCDPSAPGCTGTLSNPTGYTGKFY